MWRLLCSFVCTGEGSSFLSFKKGDLISLENDDDGETVMNSGWCSGLCARTNQRGDFPAECVYILPAITKPPPDVLVCDTCSSTGCFLHVYCIVSRIVFKCPVNAVHFPCIMHASCTRLYSAQQYISAIM